MEGYTFKGEVMQTCTEGIGVKKVFKTPTVIIPTSFIDEIGVTITINQSIFDLKEEDFSIISTSKAKSPAEGIMELRGKENGF